MKTISNRLLQSWLQVAKGRGCDLRSLLNAAGIPWQHLENTRSQTTGIQLARLSKELRRLLSDDFMGYGREPLAPELLDQVLIKVLPQAEDLKGLMSEWENFYNLVQMTGRTTTLHNKDEFIYQFQFTTAQLPNTSLQFIDSTMRKLRLFSWMIGREIKLKAVGFAEPMSANAAEYASLFPVIILYEQPVNFFVIDSAFLRCPVIRSMQECLGYKKHLPEDFFEVPGRERSFAALVRRTISKMLKRQCRMPTIECVAEELCLSVRGLRRKLEREDESFQSMKDGIRRDAANEALVRSDIHIADLAAELGFSGTAAFSRAFKAWTAKSPQEYRRCHVAGSDGLTGFAK